MALVDTVRRTLQREALASPSTRILVALSGGPDSTALLHILRALHDSQELQLAGVVHLNHQLRDDADLDEQFCADAAAALGLPFIAERVDVRAIARAQKRSIEDAAHVVRYAFFARAAQQANADVVAVGHTRDDQAETFLLRLVRGAGARGLGAMHPRSGVVVRPLLEVPRSELLEFLDARRLPFRQDATNVDVGIPRNRVRAELLPLLAARFNPRIAEVLAAEADLARADEEALGRTADGWLAAHPAALGSGRVALDRDALRTAPKAIAWRVLFRAMGMVAGGRLIGVAHVRRAWEVVLGETDRFDAPGHTVQRDGARIVLTGRPAGTSGRLRADAGWSTFRSALPIPGETTLPGSGWTVSAELVPSAAEIDDTDSSIAIVPKDKVAGGLSVRSRRPGDRLKPSAAGHRKLQDLLVDRKVPRTERDRVPIVVDALDRIVWVAGHAMDEDFRVSDPAQAVVVLRLKGVGGSF